MIYASNTRNSSSQVDRSPIGRHMEQYLQLELPLPIQLPPGDDLEVQDDKSDKSVSLTTADDLYVDFYV